MKTIIMTIILAGTILATAPEIAVFTGNSYPVKTVSGKDARNCEYQLSDRRRFWKVFAGYTCPSTINVQ